MEVEAYSFLLYEPKEVYCIGVVHILLDYGMKCYDLLFIYAVLQGVEVAYFFEMVEVVLRIFVIEHEVDEDIVDF